MKSKVILIVAVVAALVIGFLAGHIQTTREFSRSLEWMAFFHQFQETHFVVQTLERLRDGRHAEGLEYLEARLDGSLRVLRPWLETVQSSKTGDSVFFSATKVAREYRAKYPHSTPDPEVHRALSLTPHE